MKRKYKYIAGGSYRKQTMRRKRRKYRQRRRVVPGFTRIGGYYGRFAKGSGETKFHDLLTVDGAMTTGGTLTDIPSINLIAQGTTESTRIGRKCNIRNILWKFDIKLAASTDKQDTTDMARVILYLDMQTNGAATSAVTDILETANYLSFRNLANSGRFKILMDRTYAMNAPAGAGNGTTEDWGEHIIHDEFYKKCNIPLEFSGVTGAITELRSNNIGILTISRDAALTGLNGQMRIRFSDRN